MIAPENDAARPRPHGDVATGIVSGDGPDDQRLRIVEEAVDEEIAQELAGDPGAASGPGARLLVYGGTALVTVVALAVLAGVGWPYYALSPAVRPFHDLHGALGPSGTVGLLLGVGGTLLLLISASYAVRKAFPARFLPGSAPGWMALHVFSGTVGPLLVVFHAAFVPYSALGLLALAAMLVVVASGLVGRFVSRLVPTTLEGRELEYEEIRQRLTVYRRKLMELGVSPSMLRIDAPITQERESPWLLQAAAGVLYGDRESRREYRRLRATVVAQEGLRETMDRALLLVRRLSRERQLLVRHQELRKLVGAWRFFHRWLSIVLLIAILFHVAIGVAYGDLWVLGGRR